MKARSLFMTAMSAIAMSAMMTACSSDEPAGGAPDDNTSKDGNIYAKVAIQLPSTAGRSLAGEEYGQDCENQIDNVNLVLMEKKADGSYTYVSSASVTNPINLGNTVRPTYSAVFKNNELRTYMEGTANRNVTLFVLANCRSEFNAEDFVPTTATFATRNLGSFNTANRFIMTSEPYDITLPADVKELLTYDTESHPWNLTGGVAVPVERSIARFDFRQNISKNEAGTPNVYDIYEVIGGVNTVVGQIELTHMALINDRTQAYYLGRTGAKGMSTSADLTLQHVAKMTDTYVVTPNSSNISSRTFRHALDSDVETADYAWTAISSLSQDDIDEGWTPGTADYKIWRYVNENTIPDNSSDLSSNPQQLNKYTTGVIFKGKILNYNNGISGYGADQIYAFRNVIYGGFANLEASANATDANGFVNPDLHYAFVQTWANTNSDPEGDPTYDEATMNTGVTPAQYNITVYRNEGTAAEPLYAVYYYYWNRHNDNNQSNVMGPMEFAVVRNNVYKLYVNSISRFGHTTKPGDDPDPEDPDDPDEKEQIYLQVNVEVLPWTVRVNNIDF